MTRKFMPVKEVTIFDIEYSDPTLCELSKLKPEIWDIGAVKVNRLGDVIAEYSRVFSVTNSSMLTPDCQYLCKLDIKELENLPPFSEVYQEFVEFVGQSYLMSHGSFDYEVLNYVIPQSIFRYPRFDSISFIAGLTADIDVDLKTYGLKGLCRLWGIDTPNHRALEDARCLTKLIQELLNSA